MEARSRTVAALVVLALAAGCDGPATDPSPDAEAGADGDLDSDADADADADEPEDSDLPSDADEEGESTMCPPPPDGLPEVEVVGEGRFRRILAVPCPGLLPRDVTVYLPPSYEMEPGRRYPVLYMHDGQNLFDPSEAAFGVEWGVDETLDALVAAGAVREHLVVGVHNTAERMEDYGVGGKGDLYSDFLVGVLKPIVDSRFRTLCGRGNTALAGSSMGGLISLHVFMREPETFGRVAAVSPSLWWNDRSLLRAFESRSGQMPLRLWLDGGSAEGERLPLGLTSTIGDVRDLRDAALAQGMSFGRDLGALEDVGAAHDEAAWAARLPSILAFVLGETGVADEAMDGLALAPYHGYLGLSDGASATTVAVEALHGGRVRLTWPNALVTFESLAPGTATVSTEGLVEAVSAGRATIRALLADLSAEAEVVVLDGPAADVTLLVTVPASTPADAVVHVTGSLAELGSWDPGAVAMTRLDATRFTFSFAAAPGMPFEYKYTRGSWETVEKAHDGAEIGNRAATVAPALLLEDDVASWADDW